MLFQILIDMAGYKLALLGLVWLVGSCSSEESMRVSGSVDYIGSEEIYISKQPVHYKYSKKIQFPVSVNEKGDFSLRFPVDSTQIVDLHVGEISYPLVAEPGRALHLEIQRSLFPDSVKVAGYPEPWDRLFSNFRGQEQSLKEKINAQLSEFRSGDSTAVVSLYKKRYQLARRLFRGTPLDDLYHKAVGDYLVKKLEQIKYNLRDPALKPENRRRGVLQEAQNLNFFSFASLHAQRAGIRDFTNAYANTFGVTDSLQRALQQELTQNDVKRLGYEKLDSVRTSVLQYVQGRRAKAYAQMHLVAERIGEMPLEVAEPGYKKYLEEYADFPTYTSFLKSFYQQIESVSPGHPAVPFSLPNRRGEIVQMKDFRGKYVLLDFWASWCIPCLDEFSHMNNIYSKVPRDKFEIVAISIEKDSLRWRQALQRFNNPWPQLYGGNGFQQKTFRTYRGGGIPFYILVAPNGEIMRYNDIRPSFNLPSLLDSLIIQS